MTYSFILDYLISVITFIQCYVIIMDIVLPQLAAALKTINDYAIKYFFKMLLIIDRIHKVIAFNTLLHKSFQKKI